MATAALAAAREADVDADHLCDIIRTDVGLAGCILRLANSVAYARRRHATTLRDAVLTVGLRKTCDIMVAASARQIFGAAGRHAGGLWTHALAVGLAAETLARATRSAEVDFAFLTGLFHDVGRIVLLLADAAAMERIKTGSADGGHLALESGHYGLDHAEVGATLAESWALSPSQCLALRWHHDPARSVTNLAGLINAADALAYQIGLGHGTRVPDGVDIARLELSPEAEDSSREQVREAFARYVELLAA